MESPHFEPTPEPDAAQTEESALRRLLGRLRQPDFPAPGRAIRRAILLAVLALALTLAWRGAQASLRAVPPGVVGIGVNRFTGSVEALEPGTHLRPRFLYEIHLVRVSDQLLSGEEFNVTTKEGVNASLTVQARWAIDRKRLLAAWSALPAHPGAELVAPVLIAAFRTAAPRYEVGSLVAEKREELAAIAGAVARERLAESGVILKEVLIGDLVLPPEFEKGRLAMVDEVQSTERLDVTLKRKAKEVEESRLTAEAQKAKQLQMAEAAAGQKVIEARAEADAMKHVLALKQKQIEQKKLEAEAERQSIVQRARAAAEASKIQSQAEADRRRQMADAEAYATRIQSAAEFENLEREAALVTANPLLIPKTFADRLSDRVQVILTPSIDGDAFTGEVYKRVVAGQAAVAPPPPAASPQAGATAIASNRRKPARKPSQ